MRSKKRDYSVKLKTGNKVGLWVGIGVWLGYVWLKTMAGLAIHPYKSVKRIVLSDRERVLLPTLLSPTVLLLGLLVVGRLGSSLVEVRGWWRELIAVGLGISLIGLGLWQGLMLILMYRFLKARKELS